MEGKLDKKEKVITYTVNGSFHFTSDNETAIQNIADDFLEFLRDKTSTFTTLSSSNIATHRNET
jgi:hypothetical protein